jgi:NAD-dependent protein deacetylase/lipoamidase
MRFSGGPTRSTSPGVGTGDDPTLRFARSMLAGARRVLVLTGAGISVSAGLPVYRGAGGIYGDDGQSIPAFQYGESLPAKLDDLWRFWGPVRDQVRAAEPTAAHRALAGWAARRRGDGAAVTVVTMNIDDLHERAGEDAHHLHGDVFASVCLDRTCGGRVGRDLRSDGTVTPCPRCGSRTRPDMVMFGEPVDVDALWAAKRAVRDCEVFLAIGTSGTVHPANGLVRYARDVGAYSLLVNPDRSAGDGFDEQVAAPADDALPALLAPV